MSKISTYINAPSPISGSDKLIGTDTDGVIQNATKNFTVQELSNFIKPYKVYTALLTQTGTSAPVATILENTLGAVPVWSYQGVGNYVLTLAGAFLSGKVVMFLNNDRSNSIYAIYRTSNNTLEIEIKITDSVPFVPTNSLLTQASLEIRIYS